MSRVSNGMRIKFHKKDNFLISVKVYSNGTKLVRLLIDKDAMQYKLIDPVTGYVHESGGEGISNLEVLQRKAKRALKDCLGIYFEKEIRNVGNQTE